jgi:hypothetical protein
VSSVQHGDVLTEWLKTCLLKLEKKKKATSMYCYIYKTIYRILHCALGHPMGKPQEGKGKGTAHPITGHEGPEGE